MNAPTKQAQVTATAQALRNEIPLAESEEYDMLALSVSDTTWKSELGSLAGFLGRLLPLLSDDTSDWGSDKKMLSPHWRLWIGGVQCFVLTFAPFYDPRHPRYSPTDNAYVVFQFESSFQRTGVCTMSPSTLAGLSQSVLTGFKNAGRWYLSEITHGEPEALRVIKPLAPGDKPVAWRRDQANENGLGGNTK